MIGYWLKNVSPVEANDSPQMTPVLYAGPWLYVQHPQGGTLAFLKDFPEVGTNGPRSPDQYGEPREVEPGVFYLPPLVLGDFYDTARADRTGVDVKLACGRTVSIPCAIVQHRQFRVGRGVSGTRLGRPVTEYGDLACRLLEQAAKNRGIDVEDDADLWRLIALAFGQCYRTTPELLDDFGVIARDDIDNLLGAIWYGDPKALSPAPAGAAPDSDSSGSTAPNSPPAKS